MKIIGLTGGIGSGKTTVAYLFEALGAPIYIADIEAKKLTNRSKFIRKKLIALLGEEAFQEEGINRAFVAAKIFKDPILLQKVNAIIHPRVQQHFNRWAKKQDAPYCIKEAAVLFENGGYQKCDYTILVPAPKHLRIQRIQQRDASSEEAIKDRMDNQWPDSKKIPLADFVIENITLSKTKNRVEHIHKILLEV